MQSAAATAQAAADEAAAADASGASAAAGDPMQDVIKKAVQAQVAALSEVTRLPLPPCRRCVCVCVCDAVVVACAGAERAMGRQDAAPAAAAAVARGKVTAAHTVCAIACTYSPSGSSRHCCDEPQ